jgi:hypothetical protein
MKDQSKSKLRVTWTSSEKRKIAEHVYEQLKLNNRLSLVTAVNNAQKEVLIKDRQRTINWLGHVKFLEQELSSIQRERDHAAGGKFAEPAPTTDETPAIDETSVDLTSLTTDVLISALVGRVVDTVTTQVLDAVRVELQDQLSELTTKLLSGLQLQVVPMSVQTPVVSKEKRKRIVLVRLKPIQFNEVEKHFGHIFDLRLWDESTGTHQQLQSMCQSAHKIYGMTGFMSHAQDAAVVAANRKAYVRFTGGVTRLLDLLREEAKYLNLI